MKKVLVAVFALSLVAASCSKKDDNNLQDSNVMLQEPEVKIDDSVVAAPAPAPAADSAAKPADSAK